MHHFDYHETLMKNASKHFSVLILRFTMVVYLYNVKYFFVVKKKRGPRRREPSNWKEGGLRDENSGWQGGREGLSLLNFILMK